VILVFQFEIIMHVFAFVICC